VRLLEEGMEPVKSIDSFFWGFVTGGIFFAVVHELVRAFAG